MYFSIGIIIRHNAPLALSADSGFVAAPAHIGSRDIDYGLGLILSDSIIKSLPVIFLFFPVFAFAAGTVKPDAENITVTGKQLRKLILEICIISITLTVSFFVSVPRGKIYAEFKAVFPAGVRQLTDNISVTVFPFAGFNTVIGIFARPQAETVMMFSGQNYTFDMGELAESRPLSAIKFLGIKQLGIFVAVSPFAVGKSIYTIRRIAITSITIVESAFIVGFVRLVILYTVIDIFSTPFPVTK